LEGSGIATGRGILVDRQLQTNVADVYAAGDCAEIVQDDDSRNLIQQVWYTGKMQGQAAGDNVAGDARAYDPGIWFNSAKFFDLEWQVYGDVPAQPCPDGQTLYWELPSGKKSIRINYRSSDRAVTGFNLMGVRYRHELCHEWIHDARPLPEVLENLGAANFDPELFPQHERELIEIYNRSNPGAEVTLRRRRGLRELFRARRAS